MKDSLHAQLTKHLYACGEWRSKGTLTADMVWKHVAGKNYGNRYLPDSVSRTLRRLEEQSIIAVKGENVSVQYKWIPPMMRHTYIPWSRRPEGMKDILFTK